MNIYRITSYKDNIISCVQADYHPILDEQTYFYEHENGKFICILTQASSKEDAIQSAHNTLRNIRPISIQS